MIEFKAYSHKFQSSHCRTWGSPCVGDSCIFGSCWWMGDGVRCSCTLHYFGVCASLRAGECPNNGVWALYPGLKDNTLVVSSSHANWNDMKKTKLRHYVSKLMSTKVSNIQNVGYSESIGTKVPGPIEIQCYNLLSIIISALWYIRDIILVMT